MLESDLRNNKKFKALIHQRVDGHFLHENHLEQTKSRQDAYVLHYEVGPGMESHEMNWSFISS